MSLESGDKIYRLKLIKKNKYYSIDLIIKSLIFFI